MRRPAADATIVLLGAALGAGSLPARATQRRASRPASSVKWADRRPFLIGKFETAGSLDKVAACDRKKLGSAGTKFFGKTDEGGQAFEMKRKKDNRFVQLKEVGGRTEIDLVRTQGVEDDNKE